MPKETDRLKLPLPLGNESVTRESINGIFEKIDAGVATREDLDTLREAVSEDRLAAQKYVDDKTWQKYKITEDNGRLIYKPNADLNKLVEPGFYYRNGSTGTPSNTPESSISWFVEVYMYAPTIILQRATQANTSKVFTRQTDGAGNWSAWVLQTPKRNVWGAIM
ncbi:pyocin knob domain-containing protein [Paenibacillus sp. DCT19]|uniref:pyocin knob domain-containing protein n=1 Tax=Paenibacillus sp. DCT19 TaxID=2211212 RepID=UPI000FE1D574|nr:pyocin knob domain-containing protein [Paenibacillus sp. DCT19]